MNIAVISEVSARDKNGVIVAALREATNATIHNFGMTESGDEPELTYVHTGLMAALAWHSGKVDFVIGGGTGQGFPLHRAESQAASRQVLVNIGQVAKRNMPEIDPTIIEHIMSQAAFAEVMR